METFLVKKMERLYQSIVDICKHNAMYIDIKKIMKLDKYAPHNSSFFCLINPEELTYEFISKGLEASIGFDENLLKDKGLHFYWSRIHPNDLNQLISVWKELRHFILEDVKNKNEEQINYTWNYRFKNSEDIYINIVQNITPVFCKANPKHVYILTYYTVINSSISMRVSATANIKKNNVYVKKSFCDINQKIILSEISAREQEIINLLSLHHTTKEIGDKLCISPNTVNTHRRNIIKKLHVSSTGEAIGLLHNN